MAEMNVSLWEWVAEEGLFRLEAEHLAPPPSPGDPPSPEDLGYSRESVCSMGAGMVCIEVHPAGRPARGLAGTYTYLVLVRLPGPEIGLFFMRDYAAYFNFLISVAQPWVVLANEMAISTGERSIQ